jgi:hypothetical protein
MLESHQYLYLSFARPGAIVRFILSSLHRSIYLTHSPVLILLNQILATMRFFQIATLVALAASSSVVAVRPDRHVTHDDVMTHPRQYHEAHHQHERPYSGFDEQVRLSYS